MELEKRYGVANYAPLPVEISRGTGCEVWDVDGCRYLDFMSAYSAVSHGHAHPKLVQALREQAERLSIVSRAFHSDRLGAFLARACEMSGMDRALPMNTGAEAVETALKAARRWAYREKGVADNSAEIIACDGNFHGRTLGPLALSTEAAYRRDFGPFPPGFRHIPFGDAEALEAAIRPCTAAFIVEPIQGEGGIVVPSEGYLAACADICSRHQVLLICDEIQTGMGRTGRFLACDYDGVQPDLLLLGKALGGGLYPVSLVLGRDDIWQLFEPGSHGSTFGGNPLAAAIGLEALNVLMEEKLIERAAEMGRYMRRRLRELPSPPVRDVRGRGLLIGLEFHEGTMDARQICAGLADRGILTRETRRTVLRLAPPLVVTREQIDTAIEQLRDVLAAGTPTCEEKN
jgi:ornithine--oxo-acid transaminase